MDIEYNEPQTQRNNRWRLKDNFPHNRIYRSKKEIILGMLKLLLIVFIILILLTAFIVFVVIPLVFMSFPSIQRLAMFSNFFLDNDPKDFNFIRLNDVTFRNFYLQFEDEYEQRNISIGVWHILPYNLTKEKDLDKALKDGNFDVVIYFHGSGETRKDPVGMYSKLLSYFHVIAFDYRDFGDSTNAVLSEEAVARDSFHIFNWVHSKTERNVYVWGHSLGTALGTLSASKLNKIWRPFGLVLEAPFTNMREELPVHPYGKIFSWLPWFEPTILDPLQKNGFLFETNEYIQTINCPVMILHAEDDSIIPYTLGKRLYEIAKSKRKSNQGNVTYYQLPAKYHLDHFRIYQYPYLNNTIENFINECHEHNARTV